MLTYLPLPLSIPLNSGILDTIHPSILFVSFLKALSIDGIGAFNLHVKKKSLKKSEKAPIVAKDCYWLLWKGEGEKWKEG